MPKATKKPVSPKGRTVKKVIKKVAPVESLDMSMVPTAVPQTVSKSMNPKVIRYALIVVLIGLLTYKVGPWLVPAVVNNLPITRFQVWNRLEKVAGDKTLESMIDEKIFDQALANTHIKLDQSKIDSQIKEIEAQYKSTGGLDEVLKQQGMTRKDLIKDITTRLSMEELLADKITPTEDEVKKQFDSGATTLYKDKKFDDVKAQISDEMKQAKLRDAFLAWFADVKKEAKVKSFGL